MKQVSRHCTTWLWIATLCIPSMLWANPINENANQTLRSIVPAAPQVNSKAYILTEANSDQVLAEKNADEVMPPASLTKVMTMYVASEALQNGQISLTDKVHISNKAWKAEGARMFVKPGTDVEIQTLINGIVIASGNDATIALAEHIAGSEDSFAEMMNITAKRLGMEHSHFMNATGLPNKDHYTTARDLSILAKAVINDFPEEYHIYKQKWIEYNHIKQPNRNRLLWRNNKVDGIKTGHTEEAGYCLIAAAKDESMRLINVQLGAPSDSARTNNTQAILTWGMRFYETKLLHSVLNKVTKVRVWGGSYKYTPVGVEKDLYVTIPKGQSNAVKLDSHIEATTNAPLKKDQAFGSLDVKLGDQVLATRPLVTLADNVTGSMWQRASDKVAALWYKFTA